MEIRQLKYFIALATHKNFTKAAQQLYISQPTLSQQISALENELDCKLFQRSSRSVTLTTAGEALLLEAKELMFQYEKCIKTVDSYRSASKGKIALSTLGTMETKLFPYFLRYFYSNYPDIQIIHSANSFSESIELIKNRSIDVCLNLLVSNWSYPDFTSIKIHPQDDQLVLVISRNSAYSHIDSFEHPEIFRLLEQTCFLYQGWHSYESTLELLRQYNSSLKVSYYDNLTSFLLQNLNQNNFTILPETFFCNTGGVKWYNRIPLPPNYGALDLTLNYRKDNPNPCLSVFIDTFIKYWKENK